MRRIYLLAAAAVVLTGFASNAQAQMMFGRGSGGLGNQMATLGADDTVLKEIDALEEQREQLKAIAAKMREERIRAFRSGGGRRRGGGGGGGNRSIAELRKAAAEAQKKAAVASKKMRAKLGDILLPHQFDRLQEIAIQAMKSGAIRDEYVAGKLKITDGQKKKMEGVQKKFTDKITEMFSGGGRRGGKSGGDKKGGRGGRRGGFDFSALRKMQADMEKDTLAVLTKDQLASLEKMKGKAFKLPERRGFGGRRGGGRSRPGGDSKKRTRPGRDREDL